MKTIVFGGSFDPVHNGHLQIAEKALEALNADRVVFLIARSPRWKSTKASDEDRLAMLKIALAGHPKFEISLLEMNSKEEINYTYTTLLHFEKEENEELYFLFGYDQLDQLDKWYEIGKLSELVHLVAFARPGYVCKEDNVRKFHVQVLPMEVSDMSSTLFRQCRELDAPKGVLDYVAAHELYYIPEIQGRMKKSRYEHTLRVADTAYRIASGNHYPASTAYLAAMLHDIGKELPKEEQKKFMKKHYLTYVDVIPEVLYHQFTGAWIAENEFHVTDSEILDAIRCHATGKAGMSLLDRIVYASDKIEPGRPYDSGPLIKACEENIENGFVTVLRENILFFQKKGTAYQNPLTIECLNYYLGKEKDLWNR